MKTEEAMAPQHAGHLGGVECSGERRDQRLGKICHGEICMRLPSRPDFPMRGEVWVVRLLLAVEEEETAAKRMWAGE